MKHVTYAEKSLFVDDETADWLMEYAVALGEAGATDKVTVSAVGVDGNEAEATFLLSSATIIMAESTSSTMEPPKNHDAVAYMMSKVSALRNPPQAQPERADPSRDDLTDLF